MEWRHKYRYDDGWPSVDYFRACLLERLEAIHAALRPRFVRLDTGDGEIHVNSEVVDYLMESEDEEGYVGLYGAALPGETIFVKGTPAEVAALLEGE